ncbi:methionine-tRNA ligase [Nitzschia inconspicua]|uniref:methionine--tRNA ligase n=1 Tax=Nitzschia inconspicua TaxID=303405 RepID=A0A9K3LTH7_9STRA|nr:methionine-tRNA ligase [Nitzschia inconspicua]
MSNEHVEDLGDALESKATIGETHGRWTLLDESTIDYGYLSKTGGAGIQNSDGGFYLTTAINYTNGPAHMGHAYEAATSDVISRFHRLKGDQPCYFVTGADEHGQKIANTAESEGKVPQEICDTYVTGFKNLNQRILITNDDYVRTTSDRHKRVARELWKRCAANGDIYLDAYSGWYNVKEETFVTDNEAELNDFKDPTTGQPLKRVEEESYFFKMSAYQEKLIQHINDNPDFIRPEQHRNNIMNRLTSDELRDLSISRMTFSWGISVPEGFKENHVMYVWIDALSNYLTGVNALGVNDDGSIEGLEKFWPANVHIIGKDILWFHTVIWPCLLMSAGIPLPKTVFAHGFVNDKEGKKMSKSLGNVVDPHDMLDKFHVDTFRWYLCKEAAYGGELSFSEDSMRDMHNADLCDTLGNLVNRATNLNKKFCDGVVADVPAPSNPPVDFASILDSYVAKMDEYDLQGGANIAIQGFRDVNRYLQDEAPWLKKGDEQDIFRKTVVRATLEAIYALTHLLMPFLPIGCKKIFQKLGKEPVALKDVNKDCRNLEAGTATTVGDVLYEKSMSDGELMDKAAASSKKKESYEEAQRRKKEAKAKQSAAGKGGQQENSDQPEFTKVDIRVGKIVKVWNHASADKLFCEEIDVGEETGPREIASGLREHYSLEDMQDRLVLVVCNLKAAKIVGFNSNGMVLAAKAEDGSKVELVTPPEGANVGERVFIEGLTGEASTSAQMKKKKTWDTVAKELKTGEGGIATWQGKPIQTSAGPCKVASLVGAPIS